MSGAPLRELLERCCAAHRWVEAMAHSAPWVDGDELLAASETAFDGLDRADWLEAFAGHPRIGDLEALRVRHAVDPAAGEQTATAAASEATLRALAEANRRYDQRFGHLFLVFASGKSAEEMLELLEARLDNAPERELRIAGDEQRKITRKRLSDQAAHLLAAGRESAGRSA